MSVRDELTGLHNRRHFTNEMSRWGSTQLTCSMILLDIDHFKMVNDTLGHAVGDVVLRRIANLLRSEASHDDLVARFGGEEFIIIVLDDEERAAQLAERLRRSVETLAWPNIPVPNGRVTTSVGVASAILTTSEQNQLLLKRADDALYAAKGNGRNRVEHAPSQRPPAPVGSSAL